MPQFVLRAQVVMPSILARTLMAAMLALCWSLASAATFIVSNASDPGAASCTPGACSLRAAVLAANAAAGADVIAFDIPGSGVHRIDLTSALPALEPPLTIDGYTQGGSAPNTLAASVGGNNAQIRIHLSGSAGGVSVGLGAFGGPILVRGLAISGFSSSILDLTASSASTEEYTIEGCFLGLAPDGSLGSPIPLDAIRASALTRIGGLSPSARNVVVGATRYLVSAANARIVVEGNLLGVLPAGNALPPLGARPDTLIQMLSGSSPVPAVFQDHQIGGAAADARNVIGGARSVGINMACINQAATCFDGAVVRGNAIGVDASGTLPLPIGSPAGGSGAVQVFLPFAGQRVSIGGTGATDGNLIAYSEGWGVQIDSRNDARVAVLSNLIRNQRGLPIQYAESAGTLLQNDAGDPDTGSNRLQNWPQLLSVVQTVGSTEIRYRVDSTAANSSYPLRVELYASFGHGADVLVASDTIGLADAQTVRTVTLPFMLADAVVATATDADGRTSQFSPPFPDQLFANGYE